VVVVIPLEREGTINAIDLDYLPALAVLSGFGLMVGVDLVGGAL